MKEHTQEPDTRTYEQRFEDLEERVAKLEKQQLQHLDDHGMTRPELPMEDKG